MLTNLRLEEAVATATAVPQVPCPLEGLHDLGGLGPAAREVLARHARPRSYAASEVIYYQDDPTTHLLLLTRGHVRLSHIGEEGFVTLFTIVAPGRSFGEAGMLDGAGYAETASAVGAVEVLAVDRDWIGREGAAYGELRRAVAGLIARRYRQHIALSRGLYLPNLSQRLAHSLLHFFGELGNRITHRGRGAECLGPEVTQRDLGSMARGTRENVNKTLRRWEREGVVALEDRHIVLTDRPRLEGIALALD